MATTKCNDSYVMYVNNKKDDLLMYTLYIKIKIKIWKVLKSNNFQKKIMIVK